MNRLLRTGIILLTSLVVFFTGGCSPPEIIMLSPLPTVTEQRALRGESPFRVFFTSSSESLKPSFRGGPDAALAEAIDAARFEVVMAAYDLELWSIRDALLRAHRRGVDVRVVADADHFDRKEFQELQAAGIPIVLNRGKNLMHHKFFVLDGSQVWTGSMNFTLNGAYRHDNHLLAVDSPRLAENYLVEFEEMFEDQLFGDAVRKNTPYPVVYLNGVRVETYFSPDDGTQAAVIEVLSTARKSIRFLVFSFTSDPIAEVIREKAAEGVEVQGVFDQSQLSATGSEYQALSAAGLDVCADGNRDKMHHKVFLVDEQVVIAGSYNFTRSAETKNDENTLIIYDPRLAESFQREFERIFRDCR